MADMHDVVVEALEVQTAVNLSGVVHSFARATEVLWSEARRLGEGTNWVNEHPISRLFVDKLVSLAGTDKDLSEDYEKVKAIRDAVSV